MTKNWLLFFKQCLKVYIKDKDTLGRCDDSESDNDNDNNEYQQAAKTNPIVQMR